MVLCFCCCPTYKCALWGCMFELIVSLFCWYKILGLVLSSFHHLDLGDALLIFILTFWIVTLFTSFGMLVASHKRKNASYALPRLIQQSGLPDRAGKDVRMIALVIVPIDFFFVCYFAVGLWITRRYYNQTKSKYGSCFHPVSQTEPTAPAAVPPPTNPYYKGPVY
ncbi:hypothetical protein M3Y99_00547100 [Aphelenchoides fujianensis]|nr:hypothetical protein M3Y99_00547100 [Aphelenchoides fujianensis]